MSISPVLKIQQQAVLKSLQKPFEHTLQQAPDSLVLKSSTFKDPLSAPREKKSLTFPRSLEEIVQSDPLTQFFTMNEIKLYRKLEAACKEIPKLNLSHKQINDFVEKYYQGGSIRKDRVLHIVTGPPGAGKSSVVVDPLKQKWGALVIDSDHIKPLLPNFERGLGASAVHGASTEIASRTLKKAFGNGDNIILPTTGYCPDYLTELIKMAKLKGYKVGLHLVDLPKQEVAKRAYRRSATIVGGKRQIVNLKYVLEKVGNKPKSAFEKIIKQPELVDEYSHYDNYVPKGEPPILVKSSASKIKVNAKAINLSA